MATTPAGALVGPRRALPAVETEPAGAGETVVLYAVGLGATSPLVAPGRLAVAAAPVTAEVRLSIGGTAVSPERVLYLGVVLGNAALYQINLTLPEGITAGSPLVVLTIGSGRAEGYLALR